MKNFPKTITSISLSLLTIGVMAQSSSSPTMAPKTKSAFYQAEKSKYAPVTPQTTTAHKASGATPTNGLFNYVDWDYSANVGTYQGGPADNGWSSDHVNMRYSLSDTGSVTGHKNYSLIHFFTVAYDSMWDVYSQTTYDPHDIKIRSIDTVWVLVGYKNTTGQNDTVVFQGVTTTAKGVPTSTQLFSDMAIIGPDSSFVYGTWFSDTTLFGKGNFFGDSLNHLYYIAVTPNYNYTSSSNSFAVNVEYYGSKLDTFDIAYGFPYFTCTPNEFATHSSVGIPYGKVNYVNTFTTGWQDVYGSITQNPPSNGDYIWENIHCSDTGFYYEQDAGILTAFTYNITTGINNVTASGLSVGQNYPNPFNRQTQITYSLTKSSDVTFTVYDITGRIIMTNNYTTLPAGQHEINLSANSFSPGIYFYTFNVNGNTVTKKMVITQ